MPMATAPRRRLQTKAEQVQAQNYQPTPSDVFLATSMPLVSAGCFARMGKGAAPLPRPSVAAPVTAVAYGNSVVTSDNRGTPAAQPGKGMGFPFHNTSPFDESPYGSVSGIQLRHIDTPKEELSSRYSRTDAFQHGRLIAHDRHIIENQGRVTSSNRQQQTGGSPNPEKDGPPRPAWKMFNRTLSHQIGDDSTRNLDNGQYHAATMAGTRKFPLATQGDEWSKVYGGTPYLAMYRPYGSRKGVIGGPVPRVKAEPGGPVRFGTLIQEGDPGDGPQKVYGGLPWGLHSPTLPPVQNTNAVVGNRFKQVKPVWNVRPNNSKSAGQSWSQSMVSLTGKQAVKLGATQPIRQPGLNSRWLGV
jgi:hypothetical protein